MNMPHFAPSPHICLPMPDTLLINIAYLTVFSDCCISKHFSLHCFSCSSLYLSVHLGTMYFPGISSIPNCVKSLNMWQHNIPSLENFAHWQLNALVPGSTN